jgi:DNA polymerase-3 subunit delta'
MIHAYLLTGGSEGDRVALAKYLAAALLCQEPSRGEPCGRCRCCQLLASNAHPDFHLLKPAGASLKIKQVRELQSKLTRRSFLGAGQIAILAGADTMTEAAANCLLKTLEEPPEGTCIILLAAQADLLLPTIRSRCQEITLSATGTALPAGADYWSRLLTAGSLEVMLQQIVPELEKEDNLTAVLEAMALACRDQVVWSLTGEEALVMQPPGQLITVSGLTPLQVWRCFQLIENTRAEVERNANRRLALEVLIFRLYHQFSQGGELKCLL